MIPFDLEKFKAGQKALTRNGRIATFVGTCDSCVEDHQIIFILEGNIYPYGATLSGSFHSDSEPYVYDLVSMVSRHQRLIDSYNPEDTWQCLSKQTGEWKNCSVEPWWEENTDYRLHPHNDLIKAWKKGAKIEKKFNTSERWYECFDPNFDNTEVNFRLKPEPEYTYPTNKIIAIDVCKILDVGETYGHAGEIRYDLGKHTDSTWEDWTPSEDTKAVTHCLCYSPKHLMENVTTTVWVSTKDYALQWGYHIIKEWEVHE